MTSDNEQIEYFNKFLNGDLTKEEDIQQLLEDIEILKPLQADYLGFRSALCQQRQSTSTLLAELAQQIQQAVLSQTKKVA